MCDSGFRIPLTFLKNFTVDFRENIFCVDKYIYVRKESILFVFFNHLIHNKKILNAL